MSAMVRLKSKNKVDNIYAYKYYAYLLFSVGLFLYGFYCWADYSKFVGSFCFMGGVIIYFYKNSYADFSKKSKCKHPTNLEDFLHSINTDPKSKVASIMGSLDFSTLFGIGGFILILGVILIPLFTFAYTTKNALPSPSFYMIFNNLSPVIVTVSVLFLAALESIVLAEFSDSNGRVFAESVDSETIQKIEHVVFPVEGQKEEFARRVSQSLSIRGKITRKDLFNICAEYLERSNKEHSIDFLDRLIKKEKS